MKCTCNSGDWDIHTPMCEVTKSARRLVKPRVSWRKNPANSGRMRLPNSFTLTINGTKAATAQQHRDSKGWFWYGRRYGEVLNTANTSRPLEEVKAEAESVLLKSRFNASVEQREEKL